MSVSIGWKKVRPNELNSLDFSSRFIGILKNVFNPSFPMTLMPNDIPKLEVMVYCGYEVANELITILYDNDDGIIIDINNT